MVNMKKTNNMNLKPIIVFRLLLSKVILFIFLVLPTNLKSQEKQIYLATKVVTVSWNYKKPSGTVQVINGNLKSIKILKGDGKIKGSHFEFTSALNSSITIEIENVQNNPGPGATLISIKTNEHPFSFFLRDVTKDFPIYIPDYSVVVLRDSDNHSCAEVESNILTRKLQTKLQKIESEPEVSFASVEKRTLNQTVPTWLGLSRDFRIFQITESMPDDPLESNIIAPRFSSSSLILPGVKKDPLTYSYTVGRGVGNEINTHRRLEDGVLPILHSVHKDDDIEYKSTYFVSLENASLTQQKGTDYLVADKYSGGHMLTEAQEQKVKTKLEETLITKEETVLYFRSVITNTGKAPRYAWFKTIKPGSPWWQKYPYKYDSNTGLSNYSKDSVFCISKLNGNPLPNEEMAVLLQPGEKAVFEFSLPHAPIPNERALTLAAQSFDKKFIECKKFWQEKLYKAAQIHVPEKRIDEMIQAGLLHLDLVTYGNEPGGTLLPAIGVYTAIGTESSPIIQFYNSMGLQDVAKRSLTFFLDKQHEDGFMQNFGGYMVETGAVLWSLGEYFRYTNDKEWIEYIKPKVLKSCDFLLQWREKNKLEKLRGNGYGMIAGKVADPEDDFHQFMLNGYAYLGLSRVAEMLAKVDPEQSSRINKEAEAWKKDIRESFFKAMGNSPVVPLGDGTWSPTTPPWTEATSPRALYFNKENFYSHGTFTAPDVLLGPLYLVFCEVLGVNEPASKMMLNYHSELFYQNNGAFSQPYYSRHNWLQAKLGLVKPFLKTYYNTFSALADRETYTFWEHLHKISPHKTHEEAWFLMETRWMLYMEDGSTLRLLNTIPRQWMEDGKTIELNGVQSYFGSLNVKVNSEIGRGYIEATIQCNSDRKPKEVTIRLPHPDGKKASKITGGEYDPDTDTVTVKSFNGKAYVRVEY
jgi:hypothetical protein